MQWALPGDPSGRKNPPIEFVPVIPAAGGLLLRLPTSRQAVTVGVHGEEKKKQLHVLTALVLFFFFWRLHVLTALVLFFFF